MPYDTLASQHSLDTTVAALQKKGVQVYVADTKAAALDLIKQLIPKGASVMNGSSKTLEQVGYAEYLKEGTHGWVDLHKSVTDEPDAAKRAELRKNAITSEYYLGSVHALTEQGEYIVASNTGSQLPHIAFTSPNLILVVGTQKIVPSMADAMKRLEEYIVPLEDKHMQELYGTGTQLNKILIVKNENPMLKRQIYCILVKEPVGF